MNDDAQRIEHFLHLAERAGLWGGINPFWRATILGKILRDPAQAVKTIEQLIQLWREPLDD